MADVTSLAAWKKSASHTVTLPSGSTVEIRIPDLPALIESGHIPQGLLDVALKSTQPGQNRLSKELVAEQRAFTDKVVQLTVIRPSLSDADLDEVPYEDKEMILEFAMRQRDLDAVGNHLGGLTKSEQFVRFRQLDYLDTNVEGV